MIVALDVRLGEVAASLIANGVCYRDAMAAFKTHIIIAAVHRYGGSRKNASKALGINRNGIARGLPRE